MNRNTWAAVLLIAALGACAKDEAGDEAVVVEDNAAQPADMPAAVPANLPAGVTADMITQGQQIYSSTGNCYTCHGMDAKGTALAPDLTDQVWINVEGTNESILQVVRTGVPTPKTHPAPMPAMGGAQLSEEQISQVAAYIWSLGGGK